MHFNSQDLITLFNNLFKKSEQTILIGGATEPLYLPKIADKPYHQIIFTHDYFPSALHEVAHWCVAGAERRQLVDYGYWYKPDGRNVTEQQLFEQVEVKPQALEWIFSIAAGVKFKVSADNLTGNNVASEQFKQNIYQQVLHYLHNSLPSRAALFTRALLDFYKIHDSLDEKLFQLENL